MSLASTANLAATAFTEPRALSNSPAPIPNCLINAILPSTVSFILSNDGANELKAKALRAFSVSEALRPACANVDATLINSDDETPRPVDKPVMVFSNPFNPC